MLRLASILFLACGTIASAAEVPLSSLFSYQGRLDDGGAPADGEYDMRFSLYDAPTGGNRIGPILIFDGLRGNREPIDVDTGLFSTGLNFGDGIFAGDALWLEIQVRPHAIGSYVTMSPRQPLSAVPYALFALDGPGGAGGYWDANGSSIHNTNGGFVGIGTVEPADLLHLAGSQPTLRLDHSVGVDSYSEIMDGTSAQLRINKNNGGGQVLLDLNPKPADGTEALVRFFRETDTNGPKLVQFLRGNFSTQESARIGVDGADSFFQAHGGDVGIGTTSPGAKLHVVGDGGGTVARFTNGGPGGTAIIAGDVTGSGRAASYYGITSAELVKIQNDGAGPALTAFGDVGIGDSDPVAKLGIRKTESDNRAALNATNTGTGGAGFFATTNGSNTAAALFAASSSSAPAFATIGDAIINGDATVNGTATVDVIEIVGADLAEKFPVSDRPEAGMVVEIDPGRTGTLRVAQSGAYNPRVAGVVSGANDLSVGAVLGNLPGHEDAPPIALSGRVWVHCDASTGAIHQGDLLTTSDTPGHAMKASDRSRAYGATIGKAMSSLESGRGMVLVLVSLH